MKITFKINTPENQIVQIFMGVQKLKESSVEDLSTVELEIEPFKGDNYLHIRTLKMGSIMHFYEIIVYII